MNKRILGGTLCIIVFLLPMTACQMFSDPSATATAVAQSVFASQTAGAPTDTSTPTPTETETLTPTPTETPTPSQTPTITPTPTIEPKVYLSDDFSNEQNPLWDNASGSDASAQNIEGRLRETANLVNSSSSGFGNVGYSGIPVDFVATVNIAFDESSTEFVDAGMFFRVTPGGDGLEFSISPDGTYSIIKFLNGEWDYITGFSTSREIDISPGAINQLTVIADGSQLTFLINGTIVDEVESNLPKGTNLGLLTLNYDDVGTSAIVYFDDLLVTNLEDYYINPPALP